MTAASALQKVDSETVVKEGASVRATSKVIDCCQQVSAAFRIQDLSVQYGNRTALRGVSAFIPQRSITAVIGPSGCGKSTFLSCLNRLIRLQPGVQVSGRIFLNGIPVLSKEMGDGTLRRKVGMVFQKPVPFPISIWKNLLLPLKEVYGLKAADIAWRIECALQDVGLWSEVKDRLHDSALKLSGGQQQRLCIARALVLEPEVLLLDEPCSALDPQSSEVVEKLIQSLADRYTIVIVTHNLAQAKRIADRVLLFWTIDGCGTIIEQGRMDDMLNRPQSPITADYLSGIRG